VTTEEISMRSAVSLALASSMLCLCALAADPPTGATGDAQTNAASVLAGGADRSHAPVTVASIGAEPDGTLDLAGGSVAAGIGYVWANGDLVYKGEKHRFSVRGVSVVDVGAAHLTASGVVYNLNRIEDFAGTYSAVSAGATVGGGGSAAFLQNEHGVVVRLLSTTAGLRFNLAANGLHVKLVH
jgi:hypothetical protein